MLITFSGLDGAGKSTQIDLLMTTLRDEGHDPMQYWSRGGYTPLFQMLKKLMRKSSGDSLPTSGNSEKRTQAFSNPTVRYLWLSLALLDLIFVYGVQIRWWLLRGKTVVCDRYLWDTAIDFELNFPDNNVQNMVLWKLLSLLVTKPRAAFLLLIPVAESQRRSKLKNEPFPDSKETLEARLSRYQSFKADYFHTIDCTRSVDDIQREIVGVLPLNGRFRPQVAG